MVAGFRPSSEGWNMPSNPLITPISDPYFRLIRKVATVKEMEVTMKWIMGLALLGNAAWAAPIVDEKIKTTFSDYGKLSNWLTCEPGWDGTYATTDTLTLKSHSLDLNVDVGNQPFKAHSFDAVESGRARRWGGPSKRPYDLGCKPAIEKIEKDLGTADVVEIEVHRTVEETYNHEIMTRRKRNGDVLGNETLKVKQYVEHLRFTLGGEEFNLYRTVNLEAIKP